ncbi:MAG: hypothetical protein AB7L71_00820 [Vicinamibacterales bacterium]
MKSSSGSPAHGPFEEDGFLLLAHAWDIWDRRRMVAAGLAVVTLLYFVAASVAYTRAPSNLSAQVEVRFTFEGADRRQYPNGTPFSRADLLNTSVLAEVYRINDLERYLPFEQFRESLFVFESNVALELLGYEYQARLSDTRLPPVERSRIETEFKQKRDSQSVPQIFLRFILPEQRASIPRPVVEKVLNDILVEWATQVQTQQGHLLFQLDLLTPNVVRQDTINTKTSLIRYDLLRRHVGRTLAQLSTVGQLPGASTIRVGTERLSLTDLSTNLADLLEFQLNPLMRRGLTSSLTPSDVQFNVLYLQDRLLELQRTRQTAETRRTQLQAALEAFAADERPAGGPGGDATGSVSTQLSDSFLDRLIDLAGQSGAMEYRRSLTDRIIQAGEQALAVDQDIAFYQESLRLLREGGGRTRSDAPPPEDVSKAFDEIQAKVIETLTLTGEAYERISQAALNPNGTLYSVVGPFSVSTVPGVSLRPILVVWAGVVLLSFVLLSAAALAHAAWRRRQARSGTMPAGSSPGNHTL